MEKQHSVGLNDKMTESLKGKLFEFVQVSFLWFALLSAFLYTNYITDSLKNEIGSSNEQILVTLVLLAFGGLLLGVLSMAAPPFKHFLAAQFDSGEMKESLDQIQDSIKNMESEIDEIRQLIVRIAEEIEDDDD